MNKAISSRLSTCYLNSSSPSLVSHSLARMGPRTVLVTGGAGYVGSHTVVELLEAGHRVVVVDNCCNATPPPTTTTTTTDSHKGDDKDSYTDDKDKNGSSLTPTTATANHNNATTTEEGDKDGNKEDERRSALPLALQRVENITGKTLTAFYLVSLNDVDALTKIFAKHKIEAVIHFAALKAVGESVTIPLEYYANNVSGTLTLLQVMRSAGVKRLVYSSSATVYGVPQYLPTDENHPTGQGITNPYGRTKYFCEQVMMDLAASDQDWGVLLLRYFNPVGAHASGLIGEDPRDIPNNLMPYIAQVAVGRLKALQVFGQDYDTPDGTGVRDYVHVVDLATGHVAALEHVWRPDFNGCESYNLGRGEGVSVLEMVNAFSRASGRAIPYVVKERRAGDVAKMVASCTRAQTHLGWKATRTLEQMCEDTWRWQSQNPRGYV
ncbi:hypothetical protein Pcinc_032239 [Petrolisthes cinctipes]|uniref:UDP-N-acetylglucosamine 4-epimerase n=1 Tax=Petrolisthes cinctipes TaxID=88211 RepID=A0AAE1EUI0_PETCI|nr:hypothetical protein Pcinc_032239 [Petrolisthes cinctipes]